MRWKFSYRNMRFVSLGILLTCIAFSFQNCSNGINSINFNRITGSENTNNPIVSDAPISIFAGSVHTCMTQAGKLWCWGDNRWGMLGDGTLANSSIPREVVNMSSGVTEVATSWAHFICATQYNVTKCWGQNVGGSLGPGPTNDRYTPDLVMGLDVGGTKISAGLFQTCITFQGSLKCWGSFHDGTTVTTAAASPTAQILGGLNSGVEDVDVGVWHSCAVVNGGAKCWGNNNFGQIGDGTLLPRLQPVDVTGLASGVTKIAVGEYFSCAIQNGTPKCWGQGSRGELGNSTSVDSSTPTSVTGITDAIAIAVTYNTGCALRSTGGVKCWGFSAGGTLGDGGAMGSVRNTPADVVGLQADVSQLTGAGNHFCVVQNNVPKCWGSNFKGKLGDGTLVDRNIPVEVLRTRNPATAPNAVGVISTVTANMIGPIGLNTPITWTVDAGPANTPLEYRFMIYNDTTATWVYEPNRYIDQNYMTYNPSVAGRYHMQVWIRPKGKPVDYDDWKNSAIFQAN